MIGTSCTGTVENIVGGGYIVNVGDGIRAFLPHSKAGLERGTPSFVPGREIDVVVTEVQPRRRSVVLSRLPIIKTRREAAMSALAPGDIVVGRVEGIAKFGVFVSIAGTRGLIHRSELSWDQNPVLDVVHVGEELELEVLRLDLDRGRISLSRRKRLLPPLQYAKRNWPVGTTMRGEVTAIKSYGAFVRLPVPAELGRLAGLVHISDMPYGYAVEPAEFVSLGERVDVSVLSYDVDRVKLSMRR
ncbi:S1 RNA-binding domain-containing protein [Arthrobacter mobilis]|uniref:30S ribosomal protein S1 n=1 Tax=Arthrobacter mobilis TaxID=2724944 RepID=A0A7X6K5N0_9MICC|nr:S1 RNA-binding domain-containing protein [Arthrobacter mobilis]NKX55945.1 30S ribosomal protein S1 [Arthrobacter mobilis]